MHNENDATVPEYMERIRQRWFVRLAMESGAAVPPPRRWVDWSADALALAPATGHHDTRDSVRSAAVAGKLSHRTDRAARRGLRGRGQRG